MLYVTIELYCINPLERKWKGNVKCNTLLHLNAGYYYSPTLPNLIFQKKASFLTLPTYWGSDPMYSSRTKNWFHTHPLLTLWMLPFSPLFPVVDIDLWGHLSPGWLWFWAGCTEWRGAGELFPNRKHRNSSRLLLFSIGQSGTVLF